MSVYSDDEGKLFARLSAETRTDESSVFMALMAQRRDDILIELIADLDRKGIEFSFSKPGQVRRMQRNLRQRLADEAPIIKGAPQVGDIVTVGGVGMVQVYDDAYKQWSTIIIDDDRSVTGIVMGTDVADYVDEAYLYVLPETDDEGNELNQIYTDDYYRPLGVHVVLSDFIFDTPPGLPIGAVVRQVHVPLHYSDMDITIVASGDL